MLTEDYLIKMINLGIAALLRIIGLKDEGDYQDALALIDMTFEHLLGLRASMVKTLDDDRLYYLLTRDEQLDTRRLALVAQLFMQEGDIYAAQNQSEAGREDYTRALRYFLEVLFNQSAVNQNEISGYVEYLVQKLDLPSLGSDTLWPLAGYYEESGNLDKAESTLHLMVERPDIRPQILPELVAFYQRMLEKSPDELTSGGLKRDQVKQNLDHWQQFL